ncbi:MAG: DUF1573 domain-containing protein [Flavobacteriaceae bacterium]|nr:DUF1573 domain-containing protein [Flavobacteriaceae bacterium]
MKSYRHFIIFLFSSLILISCNKSASSKIKSDNQNKTQVQQSYAEITFDRIFHDFGTIKEGEIAKTVFSFTNTGENDLYIVDAIGSCGCTVPKYPKNIAIKPGESGEIEVNFDSNGRPSLQQKIVKVSANTLSGGDLLRIQAFVEPKNN